MHLFNAIFFIALYFVYPFTVIGANADNWKYIYTDVTQIWHKLDFII